MNILILGVAGRSQNFDGNAALNKWTHPFVLYARDAQLRLSAADLAKGNPIAGDFHDAKTIRSDENIDVV